MKSASSSLILIIILSASCKNNKAEIVDQLKIATDSLQQAELRLKTINSMKESQILRSEHKLSESKYDMPYDSIEYYRERFLKQVLKWHPIVDSLNWELKKY